MSRYSARQARSLRLHADEGNAVMLLSVRAASTVYAVLVAVSPDGQTAGVTITATNGVAPDRQTRQRVLSAAGALCLVEQLRDVHSGDLAWAERWQNAALALRAELERDRQA